MSNKSTQSPRSLFRGWPVWGALAAVVLLLAAMIITDLLVAARVGAETEEMVGNAERSVALVTDLRLQATRLSLPGLSPEELRATVERIRTDAREYDPLATYAGEREAWLDLKRLLDRLDSDPDRSSDARLALGRAISARVDRIVAINSAAAHGYVQSIRELNRRAVFTDAAAGLLTLGLVCLIAAGLVRVTARARLLTAQRLAFMDEKNQELEAFAARAAHDLRGPLSPIRSYAELLHMHKERPSEVDRMAYKIGVAVTRMTTVIDDMLALSTAGRPASGRASPAEVAAEVIEELGAQLHEVPVERALSEQLVACPPGVLSQILRNLLGNALKYRHPERPLRLRLSSAAVVDSQGASMVEIVVEDNGVGMDPELARHAFEPYHRGRATQGAQGYGLGLAIVERATHAFEGTCALESVLGEGTRAIVRLPRG